MGRAELLRKYGLTEDDYDWKLREQDYRCAICRKHQNETGKVLVVDHDHDTGKVRGLLCNSCNTRLGICHDNPRLLAAMLVYLEDHGRSFYTFNAEMERQCLKQPSVRTMIRQNDNSVSVDADSGLWLSESGSDSILNNAASETGTESILE